MSESLPVSNESKEMFTSFDIQGQQERQNKLFVLLQNEIIHNPDIQSLGVEIFGSEDDFFAWYLCPNNRGIEHGIPDGVSKIDVLHKLQNIDKKIFSRLQNALTANTGSTYKILISYSPMINKFDHKYATIPLFFSDEVLEQYIEDWEAGWRG